MIHLLIVDWSKLYSTQLRSRTTFTHSIRDLPYEERLRKLRLPTLTYRRCRGDMIQVFKYLHSMYTCSSALLPLHQSEGRTTRGHSLKLLKPSPRLRSRQAFFTQRFVNLWNSLPESAVTAPTVNSFKNRLDRAWLDVPFRYDYKSETDTSHAHKHFYRGCHQWAVNRHRSLKYWNGCMYVCMYIWTGWSEVAENWFHRTIPLLLCMVLQRMSFLVWISVMQIATHNRAFLSITILNTRYQVTARRWLFTPACICFLWWYFLLSRPLYMLYV